MPSFHRVDTSKLVRGAARLLYAGSGQAKPATIADVIALSGSNTNEVQTLTITGTPTGGTFTLSFNGNVTVNIAYNAVASAVQTALLNLPNLDVGDVVVTGGPGPGTPYTVTFGGRYLAQDVPTLVAVGAFTGGTTPAINVTTPTPGAGQYSPKLGWIDLGSTREGIQITINNAEDAFEIDQVAGPVATAPSSWECSVTTRLAEMTLENFVLAWEGAAITEDTTTTPSERETGFAGASAYTERRLAVLFQKPNGKIQAFLFHRAVRSPQEGVIDFRKSGDPMTIQVRFNILADATETDPLKQFFRVREQV